MKNFRYIFSLISAFIIRFKWVILLSILSGILFFLSLRFLGPNFFQTQNKRIALVGRYRLDNIPDQILLIVGEGLTKVNEKGEIKPGIASSLESQDGGKKWIFHIDQGKKWQDGKKITSEDIKISYSDVEIERPDSKTIIFNLETPFAPFPVVLSKPIFKKGFLGTGEWKVKKVTVVGSFVEQIKLSRNMGKDVIYKFYPTEERAKLALKLGNVDQLVDIFNPFPFYDWKTLNVEKKVDYERFTAVFFNNAKEKKTSDKNLRQALTYAIDKKSFEQVRAVSPISPNSWAYNPQVKPYDYDLTRAKELMKDLSKEVTKDLSLNIATTPVLLTEAEIIAKNWRDLGISVNVQVISNIPEDFDAFLAIVDIPTDPDQYSLWHSSQIASNLANYKDARIDKLLEDGRTVTNQSERKKIYLDFQRFLLEDSPVAFLFHPASYTITRK